MHTSVKTCTTKELEEATAWLGRLSPFSHAGKENIIAITEFLVSKNFRLLSPGVKLTQDETGKLYFATLVFSKSSPRAELTIGIARRPTPPLVGILMKNYSARVIAKTSHGELTVEKNGWCPVFAFLNAWNELCRREAQKYSIPE